MITLATFILFFLRAFRMRVSLRLRFGKEATKAVSIVASVGLRIAGEVELGSKKVGGDMNLISQDLADVKDGVFSILVVI